MEIILAALKFRFVLLPEPVQHLGGEGKRRKR